MVKKRLALLMAMIMAFTSVDTSMLMVSAAEVTEATEHVHVEEADVQEAFEVAEEISVEEVQEEIAAEEVEELTTEVAAEVMTEADTQEMTLEEAVEEIIIEEEVVIDNTLEMEELVDDAELMDVNVDVEGIAITPMTLDVMCQGTLTDENPKAWFSFVPDETGRYTFTSYCSEGMYNMHGVLYAADSEESLTSGGWNAPPKIDNFSLSAELEAGQTYYLSVDSEASEENKTGDFSVQVIRQRKIESFSLVNAPDLSFVQEIDDVKLRNIELQINYVDGVSETFVMMEDCSYDAYGNGFVWDIYKIGENGEEIDTGFCNGGYRPLLPGEYIFKIHHKDLNIYNNEEGICESMVTVPFTVIDIEDSSYYCGDIQTGTTDVPCLDDDYAYYTFTPEESGTYVFTGWEGPMSNVLRAKDAEGWIQEMAWNVYSWDLTAGVTYYIGFKAADGVDLEAVPVTVIWRPTVENASLSGITGEAYPFQTESILDGASLAITFGNGETQILTLADGEEYFRDSYGNEYGCRIEGNGWAHYGLHMGSMAPGEYTLIIYRIDNYESVYTQVFTVKSLDEVLTGQLSTEYASQISCGDDVRTWYTFTPSQSGSYFMKMQENVSGGSREVYYLNENEYQIIYDNSNVYELEADKTYYICFYGTAYDTEWWDELGSYTLNVVYVPTVASVEFVDAKTEVIANLENYYLRELKVLVTYEEEAHSPQTLIFGENNRVTDAYGNSYWYDIVKDYQAYGQWERLEEGEYKVAVYGPGIEEEVSFILTAKPASEMVTDTLVDEGTQTVPVGSNARFYKWTAEAGKKYAFLTNTNQGEGMVLYFYPVDAEGNILSGFSHEFWERGTSMTAEYEQYYVGIGGLESFEGEVELTIKQLPKVVSIEVEEAKKLSFMQGENVTIGNAGITLNIEFSDGSSQRHKFDGYLELYDDDFHLGDIEYTFWEVNADGSYNTEDDVSTYPQPGSYVYHIYVSEDAYVDVPFKVCSMADLSQGDLTIGKQDVVIQNGEFFYRFVPEVSGCYRFITSVAAKDMKIIDAAGIRYGFGIDEETSYDRYARLEAGMEYFLQVKTGSLYTKASVEVRKVKVVTEMITTAVKKEYLADFEYFDGSRIKTKITFDDGSTFTATDYDRMEDAQLRYVVTKEDDENGWPEEEVLRAGTYTVKPVIKLMTTGSSILVEDTAVTADTIRAVKLEPSTLPTVEKDTWVDLPRGGVEKYYAFTAPEAGTYVIERPKDLVYYPQFGFYQMTESGWDYIHTRAALNKDETYIISIHATGDQFRVVSWEEKPQEPETETPGTETPEPDEEDYILRVGEKEQIIIADGEEVRYTFTPEETAYYKVESSNYEGDPRVNLYHGEDEIGEDDDEGEDWNFALVSQLEAGENYTYAFRSWDSEDSYEVLLTKMETKAIESVEIVQKKPYGCFDITPDVFEIKVTYQDRTTDTIQWEENYDEYYNYFSFGWDDEENISDPTKYNRKPCVYYTDMTGTEGKAFLEVWQYGIEDLPELVPGSEVNLSTADGTQYYKITPSKDGRYVWKRTELDDCDVYLSLYTGSEDDSDYIDLQQYNDNYLEYAAELKAGELYWIRCEVDDWSEKEQTCTLNFRLLSNVVADVEVVEQPSDPTFYRWNSGMVDFTGLKVKVTYTDGTSETVAYNGTDSQGRGFRTINGDYWISDNVKRVYLAFDEHYFYVDVTSVEADALPLIEENKSNTLTMSPNALKNVRFIPEETGAYVFNFASGGTQGAMWCVEDHAYASYQYNEDGICHALEAGKTYVVRVFTGVGQVVVTPYLYGSCNWEVLSKTEPTCGKDGVLVEYCTIHGENETRETVLPATGKHTYGAGSVTTAATCTKEGVMTYICTVCSAVETEVIPTDANNHNYSAEYTVDKESTCTIAGIESIHCMDCDAKKADSERELALAAHNWKTEKEVDKEATCSEEGQKSIHCAECNAINEETVEAIEKIAHVWGEAVTVLEPTCTADGMMEQNCTECDAVQKLVVKATGHKVSEDVVVEVEATCTATGRQSYTCTVCGEKLKSEELPALGHSFGTEYRVDKVATCTEEGSESIHCTVCDAIDTASVRIIAKVEHQWSDWDVVKKATCIAAGSEQKICAACSEEEVQEIPATGDHVYSEEPVTETEATCVAAGTAYKACMTAGCNSKIVEVIPALGHAATASHMEHKVEEATEIVAGKEYDFCTICEQEFNVVVIPTTGQQEIIDEAYNTVSDEKWTPTEEELTGLISSVVSVDNSAMMDGKPKNEDGTAADASGTDVVAKVEEKLINSTVGDVVIGDTAVVDEEGNAANDFSIQGAALTAAASQIQSQLATLMVLYDNGVATVEETVNNIVKSVIVVEESNATEADGKLNYQFAMDLFIERNGVKDAEAQEILAPVRVTVTIPEEYRDMNFEVYRVVNGERAVISTADINRTENKVTFETPALGVFGFTNISCMDHTDAKMVADEARSKEATCAATGLESTVCEVCHNYWVDTTLSTLEHTLTEVVTTAPTCVTAGEKTLSCENCTYTEQVAVPATKQHTWPTEWTVKTAETCEADGEEERTCEHCAETQSRVINKINGHIYADEFTADVPATCETAGQESRHCTFGCGEKTEVRTIPAAGHDWDEGVVTKQATCVSDGEITYTCQTEGCGVTRTEAQNALEEGVVAHIWKTEKEVDKQPTCAEEGSKSIHCEKCAETKDTESIEKLDHTYEMVIDTDSTCAVKGSKHEECKVCHDKKPAIEIALKAHSYGVIVDKQATCGVAGSKHEECKVCHVKKTAVTIPATGKHNFTNSTWKVTKEATAVATGTKERICSVCKIAKETGTVDKLKATWKLNTAGSSTLPLKVKKSVTIKVTDLAKGDKVVSWSSSNTKVATVSSAGVVKATKKTGTVTITIKLLSGTTITQKVKVQSGNVKTSSITGVSKNLTVKQGATIKLAPSLLPITTADKIKYSTSNKKIATVTSKGVVKGVKGGKAKITIKAGSKKFVCTVTVEPIKTTSIKLNKTAVSLKKKKSTTLKVTRTPKASTETIKYTTSNKKVATVSSKGKITAKGKGTATITVTCGSAKATCTVTVN